LVDPVSGRLIILAFNRFLFWILTTFKKQS
jgi:hypothetical protein